MEGNNEYKDMDTLKMHLHNKQWFIVSVLFFLLVATVYLVFTPNKYKVQTKILINDNSLTGESIAEDINSKNLVQKTLDNLPFQVSYYQKGTFKRTELYGDSLPIKFVFPKATPVDSSAVAKVNILSDQVYEIERNKTRMDFYFDKPVNYSFAAFKGVKGRSFNTNREPVSLKFNDPAELLEYYYANLNIEPVDSKYLQLSVVTTIPEKGIDFLNKLVELYNKENTTKASVTALAGTNVIDRMQMIKTRLTALKAEAKRFRDKKEAVVLVKEKPAIHKANKAQTAVQLTVLDAISPYVKKPVNQFIQIPYGDETNNNDLEKAIIEFNKTELAKQRLLQDSQANRSKIISFNTQIAGMKSSILQKIDAERNEIKGIKPVIVPTTNTVAKVNFADSISRVNALIKATQQEYTSLLHNKPAKITSVAEAKPVLTMIEKPGETVVSYPQPALVYFLAVLIGLVVPLPLTFLRRVQLPKNNLIDLKKFNARIYELLHAKEID